MLKATLQVQILEFPNPIPIFLSNRTPDFNEGNPLLEDGAGQIIQ